MVRSLALIAAASLAVSASTSTVAAWEVLALNATNPMHEPARRLALSCALQQNVDFVGNDLTSVAGGAPGDCCAKCAATARCTAFTWSNFNGGTCWLKTGKGTTKAMAGVVSAEVKQDATATCAVENNVDYIGNDVGNAVAGVTECCTRCQSVARCTAYTWSNHNGGTCWFKSSKGATKVTTGVVSGVVSTTPATCTNEKDVDYIGNDIKNVGGSSDSCCDQCSKTVGCNAFTWSSYNGGVCYLKSSKGATKAGAGLVSGVIGATPTPTTPAPTTPTPTTPKPTTPAPTTPKPTTPAPTTPAPTTPAPTTPKPTTPAPGQCVVEKDVDYIANDLTNVPGSADSCCAACTKVAGCKAYTWSSYNGGVCYLKSGKGATKVGAGLISGYVGTTPTPTTPAPTTPTPSTPTPTTPAPGQQCTIERGLDYVGNDLTNVPGADASACCSKCLDVPSCNAFSWSAGVCYLKTGKGATTASLTVDSGIVSRPPPTNSCQISENTNIVGLDIANFPRQAADDCCAVCASYSGCGAFTWTNFNGGTCWLKSDFGKTTSVTGSHSGRVTVANPPRTHIQYALRSRSVRIKSVNLGNWLATEYWLWYESPAYTGVWNIGNQGEYAVMRERTNRGDRAAALAGFETHRKQWITEADIRDIAASGINSVRVPVGFWIIGDDASVTKNNDMNMFAPGALKYLDVLINEWAVKYNVAVMLSLHAHMGSQNGYDHSAPYALNTVRWGWGEPYQNSVQFATFLAARYKRSPAFLGMNMMNEPASTVDMNAVFSYYKEVYRIVRADGNDCILVTSPHLGDQGAYANRDFMTTGYYNVWHEFHIYFKWGIYDGMAEWQILDAARNYRKNNLAGWPGNPLYIGEWALATPTSGGRFNDINKLRELATIQMDQFQGSTAGWAFWNYKHNDEAKNIDARGWSFRYMRQLGVLPNLY